MAYFAHWITPESLPRRFDTRFFIARAPALQTPSLASEEMSDLIWIGAARALAECDQGRLKLATATRALLGEIAQFPDTDALFAYASGPRVIAPVLPVTRS